MNDITNNEIQILLKIVKSPEIDYNANSIAKEIKITSMGALKILKRLEKENILKSKKIGKAFIYKINIENQYAKKYITLLLLRESLQSNTRVKRWTNEIKKIKNADMIILYGSVLEKQNPNDIDVLLTTDKKRFNNLEKEIADLNQINIKKIHALYQTFDDLVNNIKKRDKIALSAIKGIPVKGEEKFIEIYNESRKE